MDNDELKRRHEVVIQFLESALQNARGCRVITDSDVSVDILPQKYNRDEWHWNIVFTAHCERED